MPKRKRKKSGRKRGFLKVGNLIKGVVFLILKGIPLASLGALVFFVFFGVRQALYADSQLAIQKIIVEPQNALPEKERDLLISDWLGKNILSVDLQGVAKVLEKDAKIKQATVTRHFPSHLKIEIQKRVPSALIQLKTKGSYGVISEDGMIIDTVKEPSGPLVPIEAYEWPEKEVRTGLKIEHRGYMESLKFLRSFWEDPIARQETVTKIRIDRLGNVGVLLGDGPELRLGRYPAEQLNSVEKVIPLLKKEDRNKMDYIDLQFDNVIVKRKA